MTTPENAPQVALLVALRPGRPVQFPGAPS
jgi:hypothetical protein